jgi:tRNA pseudouridine38-40 synthase
MTRWKITLEYEGTAFCGWQKQENALSVQQTLEEALKKLTQEDVPTIVAGRTDSGVHATGQVAHFDLAKDFDADTMENALNFHMRPHPVVVLKAEPVSEAFHARFGAVQRSYRYLILNRRSPSALLKNRAWHIIHPLALPPMQEAARLLIGKHDFSTFRAAGCQSSGPIRTLDSIALRQEGAIITLEVGARSFLYHQIRNIVGTLTLVGKGQWSVGAFHAAFEAADRTKGGPTAPAHGLYFENVKYSDA